MSLNKEHRLLLNRTILIRHLNFLRDGVLPQDKVVLRSLYREAKYYEIKSLCIEIEKRLGIVAVSFPYIYPLSQPFSTSLHQIHPQHNRQYASYPVSHKIIK